MRNCFHSSLLIFQLEHNAFLLGGTLGGLGYVLKVPLVLWVLPFRSLNHFLLPNGLALLGGQEH